MAHWGEVIDRTYNPRMDTVYRVFSEYFDNPTMTKLKDIDNYSMYISKIYCMLGIQHRYIYIFTYKDGNTIGHKDRLSHFNWISFQTRTVDDDHKLDSHNYIPRRLPGLNKKITLQKHDRNAYTYSVEDYPIVVTLLPVRKEGMEYTASGTLLTALETYQTIVTPA
jgi:hypothetical protein